MVLKFGLIPPQVGLIVHSYALNFVPGQFMKESQIVAHRAQDTGSGPAGVNLHLVHIFYLVEQRRVSKPDIHPQIKMLSQPEIRECLASEILHKFPRERVASRRCSRTLGVDFDEENWLI